MFSVQLDLFEAAKWRKTNRALLFHLKRLISSQHSDHRADDFGIEKLSDAGQFCTFQKSEGTGWRFDQLRAADRSRLTKRLGAIDSLTAEGVVIFLTAMFEY